MVRRMFLSETHPAAVFAEQAPGPGWTPARPAAPPTPAVQRGQVAEPRRLELSDVIGALAAALGPARPLQDTLDHRFHKLAELRSRAEGVDLSEAYRRQSMSTPELWAHIRNAAPRGSDHGQPGEHDLCRQDEGRVSVGDLPGRRGRTFGCQVLGVQAGPTYTIRIPSRLHLPAAQHTLTGIAQGTSRSDTNVVLASALQP
jgi:hypothetical protein